MSASHPSVADTWGKPEWTRYRDQQESACERLGPRWAKETGRALVAMAEHHLTRLEAERG